MLLLDIGGIVMYNLFCTCRNKVALDGVGMNTVVDFG